MKAALARGASSKFSARAGDKCQLMAQALTVYTVFQGLSSPKNPSDSGAFPSCGWHLAVPGAKLRLQAPGASNYYGGVAARVPHELPGASSTCLRGYGYEEST